MPVQEYGPVQIQIDHIVHSDLVEIKSLTVPSPKSYKLKTFEHGQRGVPKHMGIKRQLENRLRFPIADK